MNDDQQGECLNAVSSRPAGIHLSGGGNPPMAGKTVGEPRPSFGDFAWPLKKSHPSGRTGPAEVDFGGVNGAAPSDCS